MRIYNQKHQLGGKGEELVKGTPSTDVTFKLEPERGAGAKQGKSQEDHSKQKG